MAKKQNGSLIRIMTAAEIRKEFLPELEIVTAELFGILKELKAADDIPDRDISFLLTEEVHKVETFLDDCGAANNRQFFYFRELIASIRWFNVAIFHAVHLFARLDSYALFLNPAETKGFYSDLRKALDLYGAGLKNLAGELMEEAGRLNLRPKKVKPGGNGHAFGLIQKKVLPSDLGGSTITDEQERVIEILGKFLEGCERLSVFVCELKSLDQVSEEVLESYRSLFNQIQSLYDSYLRNTGIERRLADLKKVRGHVSVSLHLMEIGRALMHFYERHSDEIRKYPAATRIAHLVNKARVRANVRDFVLKNALMFATKGKEVSRVVLTGLNADPDEYILETKVLLIPSYREEDFHIRPIMPITRIADKYRVDSFLYFNRKKYDLKSAIEMAIAIPDIRETLTEENAALMIQGPRKAVEEIKDFLAGKCGAYEKEVTCRILSDQSARLARTAKKQ